MNFTFENQGTNTYLVYSIQNNDVIDSMSLGMLTNNKIAGLAPTLFMQMDSAKYIKYNVSAKISVKQFFNGAVNKKRLVGVFSGIVDGFLSSEDYMIDPSTIILDLDYIFTDVSTCDTSLICLPISDTESVSKDIGAFFKNIMFTTQFDQTENCDYVAKIMNFLNSAPIFSLADFKKLLDDIKDESNGASAVKEQPSVTAQQHKVIDTQKVTQVSSQQIQQPVVQQPAAQQTVQQPISQQPSVQVTAPNSVNPQIQVRPAQANLVRPVANQTTPQGPTDGEKKISMLNLLMHYSKENAAAYKAQKAAKKGQVAVPTQAPVPQPKKVASASFAVPGAPNGNPGFAIPGQPAPAVQTAIPQPKTELTQPKVQTTVVPQVDAVQPTVQQSQPAAQTVYTPPVSQGQPMNFGETTVLGGAKIGETTVLNAGMQQQPKPTPHLIRIKNNEKIMLNKPVFRIGKEKSYVDYFIGDNTAVSRSHANIVTREGQYFIVDTNSTNHTFVNGTMIQSNVETEIAHGDKIRLGNEDFEFKLY